MKIIFKKYWLVLLYWILPTHLAAQQFSEWSTDPVTKTLKARYMKYKATDGYYWIKLEITSSVECKMQITSTVCDKDAQDRNGWKSIKLNRDETKTVGFKVLNSCTNGWWWWYRYYHKIVYTF